MTGDPAVAEAAIREVWGGGLCVGQARFTDRELGRIQRETQDLPGIGHGSRGDDVVEVGVTYDDGSIQAWCDQEYGAGVVQVYSSLTPVGVPG